MQPILNKYNLYFLELGYYNYDLSYLKNTKLKYVCGCFECDKFFDDINEELKNKYLSYFIDLIAEVVKY